MEKCFDFIESVTPAADFALRAPNANSWVGVLIHHTGVAKNLTNATAWEKYSKSMAGWLTKKDEHYVSAHFLIERDGSIVQMLHPDKHYAYHAGKSGFFHPRRRAWAEGWNQHSIGVELVGDGNIEDYTVEQYAALAKLIKALKIKYRTIDPRCITGHENVAPGRKIDPGQYFDWERLFTLVYTY